MPYQTRNKKRGKSRSRSSGKVMQQIFIFISFYFRLHIFLRFACLISILFLCHSCINHTFVKWREKKALSFKMYPTRLCASVWVRVLSTFCVVFGRSRNKNHQPLTVASAKFTEMRLKQMEPIVYNFYFLLLSIIFLPNDLPIQPLSRALSLSPALSSWPLLFSIRSRWFYCIPYIVYFFCTTAFCAVDAVVVVLKLHIFMIRQYTAKRVIKSQINRLDLIATYLVLKSSIWKQTEFRRTFLSCCWHERSNCVHMFSKQI